MDVGSLDKLQKVDVSVIKRCYDVHLIEVRGGSVKMTLQKYVFNKMVTLIIEVEGLNDATIFYRSVVSVIHCCYRPSYVNVVCELSSCVVSCSINKESN